MQTLKLKVSVRDHRIADELPPQVPDGEAEVVIHFEEVTAGNAQQARRRHSPNRSREDIDRQIAEERASWGK